MEKVLVITTLFSSPAYVSTAMAARLAMVLFGVLVMATVNAPLLEAAFMASTVSVVSPDLEIPITATSLSVAPEK